MQGLRNLFFITDIFVTYNDAIAILDCSLIAGVVADLNVHISELNRLQPVLIADQRFPFLTKFSVIF